MTMDFWWSSSAPPQTVTFNDVNQLQTNISDAYIIRLQIVSRWRVILLYAVGRIVISLRCYPMYSKRLRCKVFGQDPMLFYWHGKSHSIHHIDDSWVMMFVKRHHFSLVDMEAIQCFYIVKKVLSDRKYIHQRIVVDYHQIVRAVRKSSLIVISPSLSGYVFGDVMFFKRTECIFIRKAKWVFHWWFLW